MIKWLTGLGGWEILAIWGLSLGLASGFFYTKGAQHKANEIAAKVAQQDDKLDQASNDLSGVVDKIADDVNSKISVRVSDVKSETTEAIKEAALIQGRLEGRTEGYLKGFEDAEKIPNTCYNDPRFLPDSVRIDAESRYREIFGTQKTDKKSADSSGVRRRSTNSVQDP